MCWLLHYSLTSWSIRQKGGGARCRCLRPPTYLVSDSESAHLTLRLTGSSKHDIVKDGMAVRTDWSIVSLPALERKREDQLAAHCLILSTIEVNRIFTSALQLAWEEWQNIIVSSAKSRWLTRGLPLDTRIPLRVSFLTAILHNPERTSPHRIKTYGERGSPCLIPRE